MASFCRHWRGCSAITAFARPGDGGNASPVESSDAGLTAPPPFATTRWSLVLVAGGEPSTAATDALSALCTAYWYPLYAFLRRRGHQPEDAEDLTQGFFRQLLERSVMRVADPNRGRFRSFRRPRCSTTSSTSTRKRTRSSRGGGQRPQSIDVESAEERYACEPRTDDTPEHTFDRRWALTLLDCTLARCAAEYAASGRRGTVRPAGAGPDRRRRRSTVMPTLPATAA